MLFRSLCGFGGTTFISTRLWVRDEAMEDLAIPDDHNHFGIRAGLLWYDESSQITPTDTGDVVF